MGKTRNRIVLGFALFEKETLSVSCTVSKEEVSAPIVEVNASNKKVTHKN